MDLLKLLFGQSRNRDVDAPADNPHPDDDDFPCRDPAAARLGGSRHWDEGADTVGKMRRESADRLNRCHGVAR